MHTFTLLTAILLLIFPAKNTFAENHTGKNEKEDDKVVILFQAAPAPLIDYEQYQLFQPMDTLDFDKETLINEQKLQSQDAPGQIPVFTPSFQGSLLIKEPENAEKGFLLIKNPLVPGQD